MNKYKVHFKVTESYTFEDPKCPSEWRGSGCYDITKEKISNVTADVWCKDEDRIYELCYKWAEDNLLGTVDDINILDYELEETDSGNEEEVLNESIKYN